MRRELGKLPIDGTVVIGEGEMDEAPMLFIGEKVGTKAGPKVDIAVDPLEGTTLCAKNMPGAIATLAMAERGTLLHAPDIYMDKIAVGAGLPPGVVNLDDSVANNLRNLARAKKCDVSDLTACLLDRDRHQELIAQCREAGVRVTLISDGDVAGVIATAMPDADIDIYLGSGGAPEGVLAAAALRCVGGQMQGRLLYESDDQIERVRSMGHADPKRCFSVEELARGDVMFAATGVTNGAMLRGVRRRPDHAITHSIVMRSHSGTVRFIEAHHNFVQKTWTAT
jgi:fructose-1,6-bisphosphatase II / sedoheptulose-1,7-bisphosphatase